MSHLMIIRRLFLVMGVFSLLLISGCGNSPTSASFDPETGKHATGWLDTHGALFKADPSVCHECHGEDLHGGISSVSCFTCHGHDAGWDDPDLHGTAAKGADKGFPACSACHGGDFDGGVFATGCFSASCHTQGIPHSPAPWNGVSASRTHANTSLQNASVCAICHQGDSPTPAPAGTPINCFNNTLCHGNVGHDTGWDSSNNHGPAAMGAVDGFPYCSVCHGVDFSGGSFSNDTGCFSCHGLDAPHPNNWRGSHDGTSQQNASACVVCHSKNAGTPGCYNNTLCHDSNP